MALEDTQKQPWEQYTIDGDFSDVLGTSEELADSGHLVAAWDNEGEVATSIVLDQSTLTVVNSDDTDKVNAALRVLVKGGDPDKSPYTVTFYGFTNTTPQHQWEIDLKVKVKEVGPSKP